MTKLEKIGKKCPNFENPFFCRQNVTKFWQVTKPFYRIFLYRRFYVDFVYSDFSYRSVRFYNVKIIVASPECIFPPNVYTMLKSLLLHRSVYSLPMFIQC